MVSKDRVWTIARQDKLGRRLEMDLVANDTLVFVNSYYRSHKMACLMILKSE